MKLIDLMFFLYDAMKKTRDFDNKEGLQVLISRFMKF